MGSILIFDDSPDVVMLLKAALAMDGYEMLTASNSSEAWACLEQRTPEVLLLDVQMPGMSGPEFLDALHEREPAKVAKMKVIFLTAGEPPKDSRVAGVISKMAGLDEISAQVRDVLQAPVAEASPSV